MTRRSGLKLSLKSETNINHLPCSEKLIWFASALCSCRRPGLKRINAKEIDAEVIIAEAIINKIIDAAINNVSGKG